MLAIGVGALTPDARAQTRAGADIAATVVEYDGFLTSGAVSFAPFLQFDTRSASLGAHVNWVTFESGREIFQANLAAGWLSPATSPWRLEMSGSLGVSDYDRESFGHAVVRVRIHHQRRRSGYWAGATTGSSFASFASTAREVAVGAWTIRDRVALTGTATASWLGTDRYLDVVGAFHWRSPPFEINARVGARPWTTFAGSAPGAGAEGYADLSVVADLTTRLAAMASVGRTPGDPIRRTLGSNHLTAGLRINLARPRLRVAPVVARAIAGVDRSVRESPDGSAARLFLTGQFTIRVEIAEARTVEIMGDLTDWTPVKLQAVGNGVWELPNRLVPGAHRLNVRVDGGPWQVPRGTRLEQDEFGGTVGVIVVAIGR